VCLAIPGKIVEIDKNKEHGIVDYGDGTKRKVNISLVEVKVGDYKKTRKKLSIFLERCYQQARKANVFTQG